MDALVARSLLPRRWLFVLAGMAAWPAAAADNPYLFGDWNGTRTRLAEQGVTFDLGYTSEAGHNFTGGKRRLTRYTDQWKAGALLDLDKLWGWRGASFQVALTQRSGRDLGKDAGIGNNQQLQEVYGRGQTLHLTVFALHQAFLDGRLEWRIGRLPVGEDFASFPCDFQNLSFCGAPAGNIVGDYWINWPTSQWATWLKFHATDAVYLKLGAYQVNPKYADDRWARRNGWKLDSPSGTTGALMPLELGWTPKRGALPGTYKLGAWYDNSGGKDLYLDSQRQPLALTDGTPLHRGSRYGAYLMMRQQVSGDAGTSGATVFFNLTQADRHTAATDRQIATGVEYKAPFQRPDDMLGLAFAATHANGRLARYQRLYDELHPEASSPVKHGYEYVAELFYSWSPVPAIALRPNVQYIRHPGGTSAYHDAWVLGLKTVVAF
jgi:porin